MRLMASRNVEVYDFVAAPLIGSGCVSGSVKSANKCDFYGASTADNYTVNIIVHNAFPLDLPLHVCSV